MLLVSWLSWWYGPGWSSHGRQWRNRFTRVYLGFSVPLLLRTLAAPWRRMTTMSQGTLEQRFRALVDNAVSRVVGFIVRVLALTAAALLIAGLALAAAITMLAWPLLPVGGIVLIIYGVVR